MPGGATELDHIWVKPAEGPLSIRAHQTPLARLASDLSAAVVGQRSLPHARRPFVQINGRRPGD